MTQYIQKLPAVFQTVTEKKFFDATFDQVFSKKDSDFLAGYIGRRNPGFYNPITDFYLPEPTKDRTWWQLEATAFARDPDTTKTNVFFYDDLLDRINYYGGNTLNQDRLFESEYYSFGPPIDYDMFINYHNYYWVEQGLPTIEISGVMASDIIGQSSYTTPLTATPPNLTLTTGMSISLLDDVDYIQPHTVENLGGCDGIILVERFTDVTPGTVFEFLPWDGILELANGRIIRNEYWDAAPWEVQAQPTFGDYITIERGALDRNAWSRTNKWFHIDAINASMSATGTGFPTNATRALRPIIQFIADIPLYKSGTQFRQEIQFGFKDDTTGVPILLADYQGDPLATINAQLDISMTNGDLVCFFNDPASSNYIWIANVDGFGIVTFTEYTSALTPILNGDIVFITEDAPFNGGKTGQTWYYDLGVWNRAFNDKVYLNQPPLFLLYDHNGIPLDDPVTYPDSTFFGSEIFSYKVNTTPGATVDPVLRFPIVFTSLGQSSDIVFQNDLITSRYVYGNSRLPISGYYYYKTTRDSVLYNNWNLYNPCECDSGIAPNYSLDSATAGQTVFNTSIPTVPNSAGKTYLLVFVNGVYQLEGATESYQVTGGNQITFNTGLALNDDVVIYSYSTPDDIPDFELQSSAAAQTVFNTTLVTLPQAGDFVFLYVYVNGVLQQEGATNNFQVTGINQITFNSALALNDDVAIIAFSNVVNIPNYIPEVAILGQTVFNTTFPTLAGTINNSYVNVYVNGVYQVEGATNNFQVTGINQITFNSGLAAGDEVIIVGITFSSQEFCPTYSKQRVIDKYVVGYGTEYQFKISVTPYGYVPGGGPVQPLADIIVSVNGIEVLPLSVDNTDGYVFEEINNRIYVNLSSYLTTLLINPQSQPPVVELQTYTHGLLDPAEPGYFEIPQQLEANPSQLEVGEITASDLTQQFSSIISNQVGFQGSSFGGSNNYRDTSKNRSLGQYILQNVAPILKSMLVSSSNDLDFILGTRFSQDEYTKFKNKYVSTATQLINQEFNPVQYNNNTIPVSAWVGEILRILNISKEFSNAFAYSYMVAQGTAFSNQSYVGPGNALVTLNDYVDLSDPRNVFYAYDITNPTQQQILLVGRDYEIISNNLSIDIQLNLGAGVRTLYFALFKDALPTYIPSTPTKVGTYPTYIPEMMWDTSYVNPTWVIIGHDGSKTIAYGTYNPMTGEYSDYRDVLLLELEKRIYNGLQKRYRNQYNVPLLIESVKSGYYRQTRYTRKEYLDITESYLNKWSAKNRANYRVNEWPTASIEPSVVPNFIPGVGNIWKLYNYTAAVSPTGVKLGLPGNWKGIFQYYYDTYTPDTQPWNMLGFSDEPSWWRFEYGPPVLNLAGQEVWTSTASGNNDMWADLEEGIIRQGPRAIYNPETLQVQRQEMWSRPGLSGRIPVDAAGEIIPVMTLFDVAFSGNYYAPFDHFDDDWVYGDGSPVEQAWMSTSGYAYSVQEFLFLMRPGPYGELMWDTIGTELSPGMIIVPDSVEPVMSNTNWQYVQNDNFTNSDQFFEWMRPKNKDQVVHAEIIDNVTNIRFGYQRWISDRILFLGKNVGDTFGQKVRTLDVNLANKLAGFTNKDTTSTYIESVTPGATTSSLLIPTNNFDVFLHKSPPINTYAYSGVVIRALADGTFVVYGYDLLKSDFTIYDRSTEVLIDVTIGGTPVEFQYFTPGATYNQGDIVRYNGVYYESKGTQVAQRFDTNSWIKLKALPITGGVSVSYKPVSLESVTRIPYGSILNNAQEVFDMLIGWGAYLEKEGWQFNDVNQDTNQISDWLNSAKQFLFWLNTNWAPDASIQLSPLANSATLIVKRGYPNDVETMSNGVYSILDKAGVAIAPNNTLTDREGPKITVAPAEVSVGGIYFLQITASETEHILIFDNRTSFNDVIYSPLLRARQQRLRFNGFRSNLWYGKMEAPGYLIIDNQLVPNYDSIVEDMRYYYDANVTIDNPSLEDLGRALIGYESKSYLDNLQVSNDVQYLFYKGAIRQKGTQQAFDKLFRSTKVQSNETIEVYEEWALKLADFGNTIEQVSTEFILRPEQNTGEVIVARLNYIPSPIGRVRQVRILNAENTYTTVPRIVISAPDADPLDVNLTEPLRQARAFAVLDSTGRISRVDVTDPGYGYLTAAYVEIDSGTQPHNLDKLYSVWQGAVQQDVNLDNIVDIDIDQVDVWTVRPPDPAFSLEFPVTNVIDYPIPNAGYVNFNDVDWYSFDVSQTAVRWGTDQFNPAENDTVWVAKNFVEDWNVYKLVNENQWFDVWKNEADELFLRTLAGYLITPQFTNGANDTDFGNMIVLQVIEAQATAVLSLGLVTDLLLTKTGANYISAPIVIINGDGVGATAEATVIDGAVSELIITNPGAGYTFATVVIDPPPSVSGDNNFTLGFAFNQTQTSIDPTYNYYNLITLDAAPITSNEVPNYENFTKLMLFKTMRFLVEPGVGTPTYVSLGDKIWVDGTNLTPPHWNVYTSVTPTPQTPTGHQLYRTQEPLINTSLFESASVFATRTSNELVLLPVYDPFKNIIVGPAKQNITYMLTQDPARYNVTGDARLFSENITFAERQVGQLWWDLSTTRFVYYEQPIALDGSETPTDNLVYRRDRWAQIFPGSTVDIYEWVKSPVPPAEYTGTGVPRDVTTYVQVATSNRFTNITEVNYYFWVIGATDRPNVENRTLAAVDVSRLIQTPKSQAFAFFAPIQQTEINNSYMFYNVQEILAYQGDNVQIQYRLAERDDQEHAQWSFFREGDKGSLVTDQFWDKMVDSLCGYTRILPISDEYSNSIIIARDLPWDIYGWDISAWDEATNTNDAVYGEILPVPDPTLSEAEKYGVQYRPRQGMFVKLQSARKVFVQAANELLKHIPIRDDNPSWNADVSTDIYWSYTNWYKIGYEDAVPTIVYTTLALANAALTLGQLQVGTILQVVDGTLDGRYVLYAVTQLNPDIPVLSLEEVAIENSAIKLLDTVYTTINRYDLSIELRELLNAFRTQVMVDTYLVDQNELFFSMTNYVLSEQKNPDWVFKSSYIYIKENNIPLTQSQLYIPDQIDNIIKYIMDAKPYHTKIRDYTSTYVVSDIAAGTASDSYKINIILTFGPDITGSEDPGHWDAACDPEIPVLTDEWGDLDWGTLGWEVPSAGNIIPAAWDNFAWDVCLPSVYVLNALTFADNLEQFVSREDVYTVDLTFFDVSKVGLSQLFPYTFNILTLNDPQTFVPPENIVGVQIGTDVLIYGQDYYAEYNFDTEDYTIYFYNDPGYSPVPVALVWFNGGGMLHFRYNPFRNEIAYGFPVDNLVVNVDTKLPLNDTDGLTLGNEPFTFIAPYAPYVAWGDSWDGINDPVVAQILTDVGGTTEVAWDTPLNMVLTDYTISSKENTNTDNASEFYRNADRYAGELVIDLPAPTLVDENIDVITVYVDPVTHPLGTDILTDPGPGSAPGVIWIDGERIEYRMKTLISPDTWELQLVRRGTRGTAPTEHLALVPEVDPLAGPSGETVLKDPIVLVPNKVWVERNNVMPVGAGVNVWNANNTLPDISTEGPPGEFTDITSVPIGGLWYSITDEALFLKQALGESIP